jgi:hypothetical protein
MVGRYRNFKDKKMKTRTDLLNHLAEKYNLQRYLEIGVQVPALNFDKINCSYKISVDPDPKADAIFCLTSDEYFSQQHAGNPAFDLIFIDGLHTAEQVKKDFENALKILSPNGFIVLHDCNPEKEEHTIVPRPTKTGHWNGDVYKFAASMASVENEICRKNGYNLCAHTVDIDNGCLIFKDYYPIKNLTDYFPTGSYPEITWENFNKNRKNLLNLITWDEFISIDSHV